MDDSQNKEDAELGNLIQQLQNTSSLGQKAIAEPNPLKKEEMERFVIERAGELVKESIDFVKAMRDYVAAAPNGNDVSAIADLVTATSNAIETLNKLIVTDKKIEAATKLKEMDINSRKELAENNQFKLQLTREELFKQLIDRKSTRLNSSHVSESRMPSSA